MTEILQDIAGVAVALGGFELIKWSANLIINRRNEKRKAESEADKQEVEVDAAQFHLYKERLEELRQANKEVNDQNLELIKAAARKEDEIADKTAKIRELQDELLAATRRNGLLERLVQYYRAWFCKREYGREKGNCCRREPAQNPPQRFLPMPDELAVVEPSALPTND